MWDDSYGFPLTNSVYAVNPYFNFNHSPYLTEGMQPYAYSTSGSVYVYINGVGNSGQSVDMVFSPSPSRFVEPVSVYAPNFQYTSSPPLPQIPQPQYVFTPPSPSITDFTGAMATAFDYGMAQLLQHSNQVVTTVVPQAPVAQTIAEAQFLSHTMALPSIVASGISLGQVYDSFRRGDNEGVYTNAANAFGGLAGAQIVEIAIQYGFIETGLTGAAALGLGALMGGIVAAGATKIAYDYINGRIDEHYADRLLADLYRAYDFFGTAYPFARRDH